MTASTARAAALVLAAVTGLSSCSLIDSGGAGATTPDGTSPTSTTPPPPPPPVVVVQTTPEAAMTSWLKALASGEGTKLCNLMARGTKPYATIPGATAACAKALSAKMADFAQYRDVFRELTITGATVKGTGATFDLATTEPEVAGQIISEFTAVRVKDKWYVRAAPQPAPTGTPTTKATSGSTSTSKATSPAGTAGPGPTTSN